MSKPFDAIVVGARCAGSPTAMLLAREGYRVLVVDRATFPSDTVSTHLIHPPGVAALDAGGCSNASSQPAVRPSTRMRSTSAPSRSRGLREQPRHRSPTRRGARCWTSCSWTPPPRRASRSARSSRSRASSSRMAGSSAFAGTPEAASRHERARVVIGADGRYSLVADAVDADEYNEKPQLRGELLQLLERSRDGRPLRDLHPARTGVSPPGPRTTASRSSSSAGRTRSSRPRERTSSARTSRRSRPAPDFAERMRAATREERFAGTAVRGFFRKPYGPGWALVGDAGYNKDFITAQGIHDAFRDAELCATALGETFSGARRYEEAMGEYHDRRDPQVLPMYEFTNDLATLEPPPPELQQLLGAVSRQPGGDGRLRAGHRRSDVAGRVLLGRERRPHLRRGSLRSATTRPLRRRPRSAGRGVASVP